MVKTLKELFEGKEFSDTELLTDFLAVINRKYKGCKIRDKVDLEKDKVYFFVATPTDKDIAIIVVDILAEEEDNTIVYKVSTVDSM